MERFLDLPAHPMFVHAPLVLLPLTSMVAFLFMFKADWRHKFRWQLALSSLIVFIFILLAESSGEAFDKATKGLTPIDEHAELANTTKFLTFGFLVLTFVAIAVSRTKRSAPPDDRTTSSDDHTTAVATSAHSLSKVVSIVTALVGVLATIWMIRTGHEGAKAVWKGTLK